jgi:putative ABC transport system permease protein
MQSLIYIWRNVRRNKLRSALTIMSVGFSLALMTVLHGYMAMREIWGAAAEKYNRVVVMNIQGFSGQLPISYVGRIRDTSGVKAATQYSWYGGNYKDEQMPFAQFGVDPKAVFNVWEEISIDPKQLEAWQNNRQGCVVDRRMAVKRGWQIGERIPLKGTYYPYDLDLVLCGMFDAPINTDSLWFNWDYLNEGLKQMGAPDDNSGTIFAKAESPEVIPKVCETIDDRFASSENPTRTQTEAAFAQMFADMLGNVRVLILLLGLVVVFSLSLVAATAMAMTMRERTTEIAVLKAIGFSRRRVLGFVLGEACSIAVLGGILGVFIGCSVLQLAHVAMAQMFPFNIHEMLGVWLLYLLAIAAGIGLISGVVPAIQAARLSVIDGLRRVI